MPKNITENLKLCISIEAMTADIYHSFSRMFPEAAEFWSDLAASEENHTTILLTFAGYHLVSGLPNSIVPDSISEIDETFRLVDSIKKKIAKEVFSLKEALDMALRIEYSMGERYFQEVITQETDSDIIRTLRKMLTDEELHAAKIEKFMAEHEV
jgi:rubrerythrin